MRSRVWLWGTFLAATLAYLIFWGPSEVLLPVHREERDGRHRPGTSDSSSRSAASARCSPRSSWGTGTCLARHITFMYVVWTVSTLAIAGYGLASFPWQLMVASFVFNALEGAGTHRVGDDEADGWSRDGSSAGCRASTGSSRSVSSRSPSR